MLSNKLSSVTPMTKSELKEILDLTTTDIKINRINYKRKTSLRDVIEIALISLLILQRTQIRLQVLETLTAH